MIQDGRGKLFLPQFQVYWAIFLPYIFFSWQNIQFVLLQKHDRNKLGKYWNRQVASGRKYFERKTSATEQHLVDWTQDPFNYDKQQHIGRSQSDPIRYNWKRLQFPIDCAHFCACFQNMNFWRPTSKSIISVCLIPHGPAD